MTIRKIDLMHREFGKLEGEKCKGCSNLHKRYWNNHTYYKCKVYGLSQSEASDWRVSYQACGMFNKEWNGNDIVRLVRPGREEPVELDGQIEMGDAHEE